MKILLIDVNCQNSSTGKIVYSIYDQLNDKGYNASICYGRGTIVRKKGIYKFGIDIETYFHAFLTRLTGYTGCFSYFSTQRLIKYIEKYKPDVIHIHELHAYFINLKTIIEYLKRKNKKVVWTFHCEFMYTGKCGLAYNCERYIYGCGKCPAIKEYPASIIFDKTKQMYESKVKAFSDFNELMIVTPSQWLADRVKTSFLKERNIKVIYNGIDINVFKPVSTNYLQKKYNFKNKKVILSIAPNIMSSEKGGEHVIRLAKMIPEFIFILIGADRNRHFDNVYLLKKISEQNKIAEYYSFADVFVICSKKETFSLTCAEAIACGTPVVGYKSGAPELIFEKPFATFVDYGDIKKLKNELILKIKSKINKEDLVQYAFEKFSVNKMIDEYIKSYEEL